MFPEATIGSLFPIIVTRADADGRWTTTSRLTVVDSDTFVLQIWEENFCYFVKLHFKAEFCRNVLFGVIWSRPADVTQKQDDIRTTIQWAMEKMLTLLF